MHECAIFPLPAFLGPVSVIEGRDNAPRRPSEVTATSFGPKYCNISLVGIWCRFSAFFRLFPTGKVKTSDFFEGMFRCFAPKVRMFMAKKPGVFGGKSRFFRLFCRVFDVFCRRNGGEAPCMVRKRILVLIVVDCKTPKNAVIFALERTRCVVKIFEGFRPL